MLQAAFGGYYLIESNSRVLVENPVYYEPGFNLMSPLEISSPEADRLYILVRKRVNTSGTIFNTSTNISAIVTDVTNGENLNVIVSDNNLYPAWNVEDPSSNSPILMTITNQVDTVNNLLKVRTIDCHVKDISDNSSIDFRITVDDTNQYFHYISVDRKRISDRNTFSATVRQAYVQLNSTSDFYVLFSMSAWLKETTKNNADFSYPQDSIFYQRQDTYNNEDYSFEISTYSHSFISDLVSVMQIPSYDKVGILLIDNLLYKYVVEQQNSDFYIDILVEGQLSGITDTFRVNFYV